MFHGEDNAGGGTLTLAEAVTDGRQGGATATRRGPVHRVAGDASVAPQVVSLPLSCSPAPDQS
jgi:hypothetical protein